MLQIGLDFLIPRRGSFAIFSVTDGWIISVSISTQQCTSVHICAHRRTLAHIGAHRHMWEHISICQRTVRIIMHQYTWVYFITHQDMSVHISTHTYTSTRIFVLCSEHRLWISYSGIVCGVSNKFEHLNEIFQCTFVPQHICGTIKRHSCKFFFIIWFGR